jgi:hypothetical protein
MPPRKERTEIHDTRCVDFTSSDRPGTVLAMPDQITVTMRDDENIADVVRPVVAAGYTELVNHHYDVAADCDVLVYARPQ